MKVSSKKFKEVVREYLVMRLETYTEENSLHDSLLDVITEMNNASDPRATPLDNFIFFLQGGSPTIDIPIANHEIESDYHSWFAQLDQPKKEIDQERLNELYYLFLYREFIELCKQNKIIFP